MTFKDHFSTQSIDYSKYRPTYPQELYTFIVDKVQTKDVCWDVGTGNGQAALELAKYFKQIIATDPSESQINNATHKHNIEYLVCPAESSPLNENSVDLVTVAQAYHWFDHEKFAEEARRVGKPNALVALWGYELSAVSPEVDKVFMKYYENILGEYWPKERKHVEARYDTLPFPFENETKHEFRLVKNWDMADFLNYLSTWSAFQKFLKANNTNPLDLVRIEFLNAWGDPEVKREVSFPVFLKLGNV